MLLAIRELLALEQERHDCPGERPVLLIKDLAADRPVAGVGRDLRHSREARLSAGSLDRVCRNRLAGVVLGTLGDPATDRVQDVTGKLRSGRRHPCSDRRDIPEVWMSVDLLVEEARRRVSRDYPHPSRGFDGRDPNDACVRLAGPQVDGAVDRGVTSDAILGEHRLDLAERHRVARVERIALLSPGSVHDGGHRDGRDRDDTDPDWHTFVHVSTLAAGVPCGRVGGRQTPYTCIKSAPGNHAPSDEISPEPRRSGVDDP